MDEKQEPESINDEVFLAAEDDLRLIGGSVEWETSAEGTPDNPDISTDIDF